MAAEARGLPNMNSFLPPMAQRADVADAVIGKSSESVQCAMLKACDTCADMGQL